jgi:NADH:ubiquinone oxidoreductase subunit F (NADH-binding)/(2Fe-2S) ferredoxin
MSRAVTAPRADQAGPESRLVVRVCAGTGCVAGGSLKLVDAFRAAIGTSGLATVEAVPCLEPEDIRITGCHGFCAVGPLVKIGADGLMYCQVQEKDVPEIVTATLRDGQVIERLLFRDPADGTRCRGEHDIPFFAKQQRIALARCGEVDPEDIDDYIRRGGYETVRRVLREWTPARVIDEVKRSGLQGRGGAGFPTGLKWQLVSESPGAIKHVVCNGDEGDPGAFMDRSVMEGDPHAVLEGMTIAAYAVGAARGFIYVRAEYPLAVDRLRTALKRARERGLLGDGIAGTAFAFDVTIVEGAGAFVCGEETALLGSIEGKRGNPRPRPPYPASKGLWGRPTLINNVETYANIPTIIGEGAGEFARMGTKLSKGTKTFALTGKVNNIGLVEVPMGITLREIIFDIGGGIPDGRAFKAAQTGGPSGGCIPASLLDTPIDYRSLQELGSMMGSGGLVVVDDSTCMVKLAKFFMEFCVDESCGKCPTCRIGTKVMLNILQRICEGEGEPDDLERLQRLGEHIQRSSLCGLGQTAPNPTLSTIRHFREEYEAHIADHTCPARECYKLVTFSIVADLCNGCTLCARACPSDAIVGELKHVHHVNQELCIHCGACLTACNQDAVATA